MPEASLTNSAEFRGVSGGMLLLVVDPMLEWIEAFCSAHLDAEYAHLSRRVLGKLARKRPTPLDRGDLLIWAASIVYAVGQINLLTDPSQTPHMTLTRFSEASGVTKSSLSAKARLIRETLRIREFDPEFCRQPVTCHSQSAGLVKMDGLVVDARALPTS